MIIRFFLYLKNRNKAPYAVTKSGCRSGIMEAGKRADAIISQKRLWLNPDFTLKQLARESGSNRTYISKYISKEKGCCFREYINTYRTEHAFDLIRAGKQKTMADVAMLSGFGSVRSFRSSFIKRYGFTPLDMIKSSSTPESGCE